MNSLFPTVQAFNQSFQAFRKDPMQYLISKKLNIPSEFQNDYQGAVQYLLNTGQMSQDQLNQLLNVAKQIQQTPGFRPE